MSFGPFPTYFFSVLGTSVYEMWNPLLQGRYTRGEWLLKVGTDAKYFLCIRSMPGPFLTTILNEETGAQAG